MRPNSENKSMGSISSVNNQNNNHNSNNEQDNSMKVDEMTSSDMTTSSDSDTSTPTRVIGTSETILDIERVESLMQQSSVALSRPQSVVSSLHYQRKESFDLSRPKTATAIPYDDIPIKSRAVSKENLNIDDIPIKSRHISRESVAISFDDIPIKSRATSRESLPTNASRSPSEILKDPFRHTSSPTPHEIDDISSNSVETRSDSDEDFDDNSAKIRQSMQDLHSESYTPKSSRTIKSFASSEAISDNQFQDITTSDEVDYIPTEIKPLTKSPVRKYKAIPFRSKKVAPIKTPSPANVTPTSTKSKTSSNEIYSSGLRKFDRPREALGVCVNQLESSSWEVTMTGLQGFVRLIRHHPELVETNIHLLTVNLAKQVKNLRSQVARAACQAAGEYFITHRKALELESEDLVASLLNRTADTNKFLRADAGRALEAMCDHLSPTKVINIISFRGAVHPNAIVRTTTAKLFNRLVSRIGCDKVFSMNKEFRDKLILNGANLLQEGSLDTRNYTKDMFKQLSMHNSFNKVLLDVIPARTYRNIEKTLKNIR